MIAKKILLLFGERGDPAASYKEGTQAYLQARVAPLSGEQFAEEGHSLRALALGRGADAGVAARLSLGAVLAAAVLLLSELG